MADYKITVEGYGDFTIDPADLASADIRKTGEQNFHVLKNNRSFNAEIIDADPASKVLTIKVNDNIFQVSVSDPHDQLVNQMGLSAVVAHKIDEIKAPMPGLVVEVLVKEGQEIRQGDSLIILEAMKMENIIKSPGEGVIKTIFVEKGNAVDKGMVLLKLE